MMSRTATDSTIDRLRHDENSLRAELELGGSPCRGRACRCPNPAHADEHPSAGIYPGKADGAWRVKCQSCGWSGDIFDLRALRTGRPLADVLRDARGDDIPASAPRRPTAPPAAPKIHPTLDALWRAADYGNSRQHGDQYRDVRHTTYRYTDPATGIDELLVLRADFAGHKAIRQAHQVEGGYVLRGPDGPLPLYRRDVIADADAVVVVEGEKCADALNDIGIASTTPAGGAGKAALTDWTPLAGKTCTLWPDADAPDAKGERKGIAHMRDVARILAQLNPPARSLWIDPDALRLDDGGDVADLLDAECGDAEHQRAAVQHIIAGAVSLGPSAEVRCIVEDAISGRRFNAPWPWRVLTDSARALLPQTVTLLVGGPGVSKSLMLIQAAQHWHDAGLRPAVLELEDKRAAHLRRAIAQRAECADLTDDAWCKVNPEHARRLLAEQAAYADQFGACVHELPGDQQPTHRAIADWIMQRADAGHRIIAVDPLSIAQAERDQWAVEQRFIAHVKRTAEQFDCSIVLVVHPRKGHAGITLDDIAGGAALTRLAHAVLWLEYHREPRSVVTRDPLAGLDLPTSINRTLYILKARNGRGMGWRIGYQFDPASLTMTERGVILKRSNDDA